MFRTLCIGLLIFCASLFGQEAVFHTLRADKKLVRKPASPSSP
jgi:hypothetical protein